MIPRISGSRISRRNRSHTAGILRELGIAVHGEHARTGVRADWMEQDGPALFITGETDTYRCETTQRLAL